jgi:transcriptional regulator with XRE-family HTH domain
MPAAIPAAELRDMLADLGVSQTELARRLGVSRVTVNRWCQGIQPVPPYAVAYISAAWLTLPAAK